MKDNAEATVESSAFFIRDHFSGSEIIVFGDVEPDSISLDPRNRRIWEVAAPKVASGDLRAIFIECSYDDSAEDCSLYGHLCPRHLVAELKVLASKVTDAYHPGAAANRKRRRRASSPGIDRGVSPRTKRMQSISGGRQRRSDAYLEQPSTNSRLERNDYFCETPDLAHGGVTPSCNGTPGTGDPDNDKIATNSLNNSNTTNIQPWPDLSPFPLSGLSVYIIHIKEEMSDGPPPRDRILEQLRAHGEDARLGCKFYVPKRGEGIWI